MILMELQLGLALPSSTATAVKGIDLNSYMHEPRETMGSDPSVSVSSKCSITNNSVDVCFNDKKRSFDEAFEQVKQVPRTMPLLHWSKQPNDEDDDPKDPEKNSSSGSNKTTDEEAVVGWPPIKNWRKKLCYQHHGGGAKNNQTMGNGSVVGGRQWISMYVKVNMEGVAITRKLDLSLHSSFETLTATLISMFGLWHEDSNHYQLTYQDKEGDWLIAGDVPWRTFIRTVQRLKLLKSYV